MKSNYYLVILLLFLGVGVNAQQIEPQNANYVGTVAGMRVVPSLASRSALIPAQPLTGEPKDGRSTRNVVVPGKDPQKEDDYFSRNPHRLTSKIPAKAPSIVFNVDNNVSSPSDPSLGIGPDHVFIVYNTGFSIYDKSGVEIMGPLAVENIFSNGGCCDLTISYDNAADRWVVSYLFVGAGIEVAVSDGPDPTTANWFVYSIPQVNDYNKLSVWSDGYYITDNTGSANKVWAMERDEMIAGNPAAGIQGFDLPGIATSGFFSPQALNVTNDDLPAPGGATIIYLQDDAFAGVPAGNDHVKYWTIDVDWATPANSTVSAPTEIAATPFIGVFDGGSFSNLTQPGNGVDIDALQATVMNQAQFRKFPGHNSALFNFVIDVDASGGEKAAVRWYEFRQTADNEPWTLFQEGTYEAPDTPTGGEKHAWHASMVMDQQGNIGMGYSAMTVDPNDPNPVRVSSYYTGRFANDPINTMTIAEEVIQIGDGNIPGLRYGDYSKIDLNPSNDKEMWFINEHRQSGGTNSVGVFQIAPNFTNDVGVVSIDTPVDGTLGNAEQITVTIFNFGEDPQSDIPVNLTIDGTSIADEVFAGPLASATAAQYTFTATGDFSNEGQTYSITATTNLVGDEDNGNDAVSKDVLHVLANDIGVVDMTSPTDGGSLGLEDVTIVIENFGAQDQSGFDVQYKVGDNTPVVENVAATVAAGSTLNYTFTQQADLTSTITYPFSSRTLLAGDSDPSNDLFTTSVTNEPCAIDTNDTQQPIGPNAGTVTTSIITIVDDFLIEDVNVELNLNHTFTGDLDIFLEGPDGTTVELSTDNGGGGDNMTGTIFDDDASTDITAGSAPFTGSFRPEGSLSDFNALMSAGDWTLTITDDANQDGGELLNWSLQICSDGLLNIVGAPFEDGSELIVLDQGNDQYKLQLLTTEITDRLEMSVTNMLGQTLAYYRLVNENGQGYEYNLDMSYASAGVYIVRIGNENYGSVKRIIVR